MCEGVCVHSRQRGEEREAKRKEQERSLIRVGKLYEECKEAGKQGAELVGREAEEGGRVCCREK